MGGLIQELEAPLFRGCGCGLAGWAFAIGAGLTLAAIGTVVVAWWVG